MVGTNLKAETMKLMDKRSGIETEMNVIIERLCQPGGPGLSGNLLDAEGFPRADIDIPSVRADRYRLAELRNDHNDITEKINQNIQLLHSTRVAPTPTAVIESGGDAGSNDQAAIALDVGTSTYSSSSIAGVPASTMDVDMVVRRPFALVDEITEASPAAEDGLQLGDQVVKFGSIEYGEHLQQKLAAEAHLNQGRAVSMVVLRQGAIVNLTVTPRAWEGRDLLGCHLRIL